jgi:hypothetical protein
LSIYNSDGGDNFSNLPQRRQDVGDPVGVALKELYSKYEGTINCVGLRKYLSHWHKMRASVAIRLGEIDECVREVLKSIWYNPFNYKVYGFAILAIMPSKLMALIISHKN